MASSATKAHQKAQKKKIIILSVMMLATAMTWGKALFAKDEKSVAAANPTAAALPIAGAPLGAGSATASGSQANSRTQISSYAQATQRMEMWPSALKRRVHSGRIEDIVPFAAESEITGPADGELALESPTTSASPTPTAPVKLAILYEDLHLKLTSTAIMGKSRYARINGEQVTVGQVIEVQVGPETVRYEVSAIHAREVEIRYSGETYSLRIKVPGLNNRAQEGA